MKTTVKTAAASLVPFVALAKDPASLPLIASSILAAAPAGCGFSVSDLLEQYETDHKPLPGDLVSEVAQQIEAAKAAANAEHGPVVLKITPPYCPDKGRNAGKPMPAMVDVQGGYGHKPKWITTSHFRACIDAIHQHDRQELLAMLTKADADSVEFKRKNTPAT